jgi:hypothetical protein
MPSAMPPMRPARTNAPRLHAPKLISFRLSPSDINAHAAGPAKTGNTVGHTPLQRNQSPNNPQPPSSPQNIPLPNTLEKI